ncbi:NAP1-related protein 2 [Sesamum angolense]|uniref:NAP1-related protein 2 n=1 Tax=Sesamum angolense TaxID=2727404 RepID=A0AAE1WGL8_9LAMI|nr:NAP1-related protein 2 [Sesamum angolense]
MVSNRAKKSRTAAAEDDDQFERDDMLLAIEKLQEAQEELEKVNEEANEKILEIEQKYNEMREPVYAKRNEVISSIPVLVNCFHESPYTWSFVDRRRSKETCADFLITFGILTLSVIRYLSIWILLRSRTLKTPERVTASHLTSRPNPYFENTELTKTIKFFDEGTLRSTGTTIRVLWMPVTIQKRKQTTTKSEQVAELIKEDLWPNPIEHLNNEDDEDYTDDDDDDGDEGDEDDNDEDGCGNDDE